MTDQGRSALAEPLARALGRGDPDAQFCRSQVSRLICGAGPVRRCGRLRDGPVFSFRFCCSAMHSKAASIAAANAGFNIHIAGNNITAQIFRGR